MRQSDFEGTWQEFADADTQVQAPPRVRLAVMAEWDTSHRPAAQTPPRHRRLVTVAALAAAIVVAAAAVVVRDRPQPATQLADRMNSQSGRAPEATAGAATGSVVRLVADATLANEPLQIIRVRLPRTSLEALGITLDNSEASSLVDVDVVVGSDGLPRAIQQIRPALDNDRQ
jgi:hypothetical protein